MTSQLSSKTALDGGLDDPSPQPRQQKRFQRSKCKSETQEEASGWEVEVETRHKPLRDLKIVNICLHSNTHWQSAEIRLLFSLTNRSKRERFTCKCAHRAAQFSFDFDGKSTLPFQFHNCSVRGCVASMVNVSGERAPKKCGQMERSLD
jgi:hypothetical protein